MALRNRLEGETLELKGVILELDASSLKLGNFESLQNLVPGDLKGIKKKRGVSNNVIGGPTIIADPCA